MDTRAAAPMLAAAKKGVAPDGLQRRQLQHLGAGMLALPKGEGGLTGSIGSHRTLMSWNAQKVHVCVPSGRRVSQQGAGLEAGACRGVLCMSWQQWPLTFRVPAGTSFYTEKVWVAAHVLKARHSLPSTHKC